MKFARMTLLKKLLSVILPVIACVAVIAFFSVRIGLKNRSEIKNVSEVSFPALDKADQLKDRIAKIQEYFSVTIEDEDSASLAKVHEEAKAFEEVADDLLNRRQDQTLVNIKTDFQEYVNEGERITRVYLESRDITAISQKLPFISKSSDSLQKALDAFRDAKYKEFSESLARVQSTSRNSITLTIVSFVLVILLIGFLVYILNSRVVSPLKSLIDGIMRGIEEVTSGSGQVAFASQSVAEGSAEMAASLEETTSSLEEMASMTRQNADNADQADKLMKDSNQVVAKADNSMTELTASMQEISKASEETSKIIKTIDEIAFQTNLLALNAAVEAARAGEAGAGFAVVADEVRNLAMRAAEAAKNTAGLIEGTVKKIKDGSGIVTSTNEAFGEVAQSASKVGELVSEIAAASNEQAQGIDDLNSAVSEMDKVVQKTAANSEDSAAASEEMDAQAKQMYVNVKDLMAIIGGSRNDEHATRYRKRGVETTVATRANAIGRVPAAPVKTQVEAKQVAAAQGKEVKPDDVIPKDEAEEFKDF